MLKIKNNDYAFLKGIECRFWQVEENLYRLQTSFKAQVQHRTAIPSAGVA
ncbi:hypothetical protein [Prevotella jejuni]|nr:hypothetical protein [Prevotella jejuni]QUB80714.1 hypothetical protein J5A63_07705 [Prevotella jejuni]